MTRFPHDAKALLRAHGLRPKHHLGQNFLLDDNHLRLIVEAADIKPGQIVLEVGPGTGALSVRLLEAGAQLVAVEVDGDLELLLQAVLEPFGSAARLLMADVLAQKHRVNPAVSEALRAMGADNKGAMPSFMLVSNLPYQIASPLLANLAAAWPAMPRAVVTVQLEVAQRLCAAPGTKAFGPLSVVVQAMCQTEMLRPVGASCFWPIPKVDSAVVRLDRRDPPFADDPAALETIVRKVFGQRRKQLGSILKRTYPGRDLPVGFDPSARPEQLSVEQWVSLAAHLDQAGPASRRGHVS